MVKESAEVRRLGEKMQEAMQAQEKLYEHGDEASAAISATSAADGGRGAEASGSCMDSPLRHKSHGAVADRERLSYLAALTLLFSYFELLIPRPVPFFRLGLANIVLLLALELPLAPFLLLSVLKAAAASLMGGTLFSPFFLVSLAQSVASAALMYAASALNRATSGRLLSVYGISVLGSAVSAAVQLALSALYLGSGTFALLGPMLLFNTASGLVTAFFAVKLRGAVSGNGCNAVSGAIGDSGVSCAASCVTGIVSSADVCVADSSSCVGIVGSVGTSGAISGNGCNVVASGVGDSTEACAAASVGCGAVSGNGHNAVSGGIGDSDVTCAADGISDAGIVDAACVASASCSVARIDGAYTASSTHAAASSCEVPSPQQPPAAPEQPSPQPVAMRQKRTEALHVVFALALLLLSASVFFIQSRAVLCAMLCVSLAAQRLCKRRILLLPHLSLWLFVLIAAIFVPEGKVLFSVWHISVTEGALRSGVQKALRLSTVSALSQCAVVLQPPAGSLLSLTLAHYKRLSDTFRATKGTLLHRISVTLSGAY